VDDPKGRWTMASVELVLLGGFQARAVGRSIDVPGRKERALLAVLALPPGKVRSRDKLAGLLWSDRGDKQARDSLKSALSRLKEAFGSLHPLPIVSERECVSLDREQVAVDVAVFERLISEGTADSIAHAMALYRGDLLEGLDVRDPAFEEWLQLERQRLRVLVCDALGTLLDHHLVSGARDSVAAVARRLLQLDPLREGAHRALMQIYAEQGQTALALKQYQLCRDTLQRELGVKPEPETERLYRSIDDQNRRRQPP
jgi:DNA-binding SARP family transcriptional activator